MSSDPSRFDPRGYGHPNVPPLHHPQNTYPYSTHPQPPHPQPQPPPQYHQYPHHLDAGHERYPIASSSHQPDPQMDAGGPLMHHGYMQPQYSHTHQHQRPPEPHPPLGYANAPHQPHQPHPPPPQQHFSLDSNITQTQLLQVMRAFNTTIQTVAGERIADTDVSGRAKQIASLPPQVFNSLIQSAVDGLSAFDPNVAQRFVMGIEGMKAPEVLDKYVPIAPRPGPSTGDVASEDEEEGPDGKKRKRNSDDPRFAEPQECLTCHVKSSPEWRRGPFGPRTLCNACGLVYIKIMKRRAKGLPDEEDEGGGDDDDGQDADSYGSD